MNYIRERQALDGSLASGAASNASNRLNSRTSKLTYYYRTKYGLSLAYLRTHGDSDASLYSTGEPVSGSANGRSEEHTSELQSQSNLVCRLLLEKKSSTISVAALA